MGFYTGKNVLVTGAAGITGHAAVKRLLNEGANVRATVYSNRGLKIEPHPNLEVIKCDLMKHEDCMMVLKDIDVVFNFVAFIRGAKGQTEYGNALDLVRNNLFTSINMIDADVRSKTPLFGFIGSSTMYPDVSHPVNEDEAYSDEPHKLYRGVGWMKRYVEQVIRYYQDISETKFGVVRTTAIYGPHDAFNENGHAIPQLILKADTGMNPFEVWGDGTQTRDFIYVDDVVDAVMTVVEKAPTGRPYNASTGKGTTVTELVETITDIYGYKPEFSYDVTKPTMIPVRLVDVSRIKNEVGWEAKTSLREGLEKTIEWYKNNRQ
jgi:GDP-L-fucose synthase